MRFLGWVFRRPWAYRGALSLARGVARVVGGDGWLRRLPGYGAGWTLGRDVPPIPAQSFRDWWDARQPDSGASGGSGEVNE